MPKITFTEPLFTNQHYNFGDLGVYEGEANMKSRDGEGKMVGRVYEGNWKEGFFENEKGILGLL